MQHCFSENSLCLGKQQGRNQMRMPQCGLNTLVSSSSKIRSTSLNGLIIFSAPSLHESSVKRSAEKGTHKIKTACKP